MKRRRIMLLLCILTVLAAATTLTRCGSGVGGAFDGNANTMKF